VAWWLRRIVWACFAVPTPMGARSVGTAEQAASIDGSASAAFARPER